MPTCSSWRCAPANPDPAVHSGYSAGMSRFHELTMRSITGEEVSLAAYRGKVCLVVNVASL